MAFRKADDIVNDTDKGASELLFDAGNSIIGLEEDEVIDYLKTLIQGRYSMTPMLNLANEIFLNRDNKGHKAVVNQFLENIRRSKELTIQNAVHHLKQNDFEKIGTISYSSTVIDILMEFKKVSILESRPLMEGRKTAEKLIDYGCNIDFYTDSALSQMISGIDAFITGADTISGDAFLNKMGTLPAVIVSSKFEVPVFVTADKSKILPQEVPLPNLESHPPEEVWDTDIELGLEKNRIDIHNDYFEEIPWHSSQELYLINETGVISDKKIEKMEMPKASKRLLKYHPLV